MSMESHFDPDVSRMMNILWNKMKVVMENFTKIEPHSLEIIREILKMSETITKQQRKLLM